MPVVRRTLLGAGLAATAAALAGCGDRPRAPRAVSAAAPGTPTPRASAPPSPPAAARRPGTPAGLTFTPGRTLRRSTHPCGYAERLLRIVRRRLSGVPGQRRPGYAGAVLLLSVDGEVMVHEAVGHALRYGTGPVDLPRSRRVPMRPDSVFDLASITKVFTALLVLEQADRGRIDLAAPVDEYLPAFRGAGKRAVTVAMLLSHTGGLPVGLDLRGRSTPAARRAAILSAPLLARAEPGTTFRYSGLGLMVLGLLVEEVTGRGLAAALHTGLTGPLRLRDTGFNPREWLDRAGRRDRLVATDARRPGGLLRGVAHDGTARAMGGVAGHAGLFGTAMDLAVLGQTLVNGGEYAGARVLREQTVRRMLADANPGLPVVDAERPHRTSAHGLGVDLDQPWFMGRLASPLTFGHTGFTGTSLVVDPHRRVVLALLTNRAHPDWTWADPDPLRVEVADAVARALG